MTRVEGRHALPLEIDGHSIEIEKPPLNPRKFLTLLQSIEQHA